MALLLALVWGSFFFAHIIEWFPNAGGEFPPWFVWAAQFFHFTMLAGLVLMLKWEKLGALVMLIGTVAFATRDADLLFIIPVNLVPIVFFSIYWKLRKSERISPV